MRRYNGWRNVETWRVQLHLANDETTRDIVSTEASRRHIANNSSDLAFFDWLGEEARFGEWLRELVTNYAVEDATENTWDQFRGDVVSAALARVDWEEIATHWLADARHEVEQEGRA